MTTQALGAGQTNSFADDLRRTWVALGIVVTAASICTVLVRSSNILWANPIKWLLDSYRDLVNTIFGWFPFELSTLTEDLLVIWFAVGSTLVRTFFFLFATGAGKGVARWSAPLISVKMDQLIFKTPLLKWIWLVAALILWPVAMFFLLRKPIVCFSKGRQKYALVGRHDDIPNYGGTGATYTPTHDLRFVFTKYLFLVALCVGAVIGANAAMLAAGLG